ncbi:MAG: hypothetical protein HON47_04605 [Candidatus Diapherotrites archaeon]|jgi:hypothetical protein|uniref:Uncharacterized protein n=1 Tax=Candidatus Iainarchaeum sp. TaxID=3101447 RepID=A0A8T5GG92_9ARCH|nr:hypothetical protein [Candidatus Diapherotrites archaeon]MBT7241736.1 hypothetical protein [Candidatus Diapherotrites archaeon]
MKKANKITRGVARSNVKASVLKTRSEMLLNKAYLDLVNVAKANGITVEELIAERKKRK